MGSNPAVISELISTLRQELKTLEQTKRRRELRYTFHRPLRLGSWDASTLSFSQEAIAYLQNLSESGLAFYTETRLTPGQEFDVQLEGFDDPSCVLHIRIVHLQQVLDNTFRVGAKIV